MQHSDMGLVAPAIAGAAPGSARPCCGPASALIPVDGDDSLLDRRGKLAELVAGGRRIECGFRNLGKGRVFPERSRIEAELRHQAPAEVDLVKRSVKPALCLKLWTSYRLIAEDCLPLDVRVLCVWVDRRLARWMICSSASALAGHRSAQVRQTPNTKTCAVCFLVNDANDARRSAASACDIEQRRVADLVSACTGVDSSQDCDGAERALFPEKPVLRCQAIARRSPGSESASSPYALIWGLAFWPLRDRNSDGFEARRMRPVLVIVALPSEHQDMISVSETAASATSRGKLHERRLHDDHRPCGPAPLLVRLTLLDLLKNEKISESPIDLHDVTRPADIGAKLRLHRELIERANARPNFPAPVRHHNLPVHGLVRNIVLRQAPPVARLPAILRACPGPDP